MSWINKESMFLFLISFWSILLILSNVFEAELSKTSIIDITPEKGSLVMNEESSIWNWLEKIPGIKIFVPLGKIMLFEYTDNIPVFMSIILNITFWSSVFIVLIMLRGN